MVVIVQAVSVHEMAVRTSEFGCPLIHQIHKAFDGTGDMLSHRIGNLIGGTYENAVETLLHGDGFPHVHTHVGAVARHGKYRLVGKGDGIVQIALLHGHQTGEDLRGAGGKRFLMDIFGIQNSAGVHIHKNSGLCACHRAGGPVVDVIGFNGKGFLGFLFQLQLFQRGGIYRHPAAEGCAADNKCRKQKRGGLSASCLAV